jgi:hypothetical protein
MTVSNAAMLKLLLLPDLVIGHKFRVALPRKKYPACHVPFVCDTNALCSLPCSLYTMRMMSHAELGQVLFPC